jgi:subtilisin family serine protease
MCLCLTVVILSSALSAPVAAASTHSGPEPASTTETLDALSSNQTVVVELSDSSTTADAASVVSAQQAHATSTQRALREYAAAHPSVSITRQFWVTNAVVLTLGVNPPPIEELRGVENVERVHRNFDVRTAQSQAVSEPKATADPATTQIDSSATGSYTYGVERTGAPDVWESYGTQGGGVRVAVLDTGADPDHPDIQLARENWAAFRTDGSERSVPPFDDNGHGTHVSGTVTGDNATGTWIGVAPNSTLLHAKVADSNGIGTFAQFIAGLEWAIQSNADVIVFSYGTDGTESALIDPIVTAEQAGITVVASAGNSGVGTSSSPANVYDSVAVGAVDSRNSVATFSGGEQIATETAWTNPPSEWPANYTVPDVVAPGVRVISSAPNANYQYRSGTSMAAPHAAGAIALLLSATETQLTPNQIERRIKTTADRPAADSVAANRSGSGVVNATALLQTPIEPIGAATSPPNDLDADGRYEDVNGDGAFNIGDVAALFTLYRSGAIQDQSENFDFNNDGSVNIGDVSQLFIMNSNR